MSNSYIYPEGKERDVIERLTVLVGLLTWRLHVLEGQIDEEALNDDCAGYELELPNEWLEQFDDEFDQYITLAPDHVAIGGILRDPNEGTVQ